MSVRVWTRVCEWGRIWQLRVRLRKWKGNRRCFISFVITVASKTWICAVCNEQYANPHSVCSYSLWLEWNMLLSSDKLRKVFFLPSSLLLRAIKIPLKTRLWRCEKGYFHYHYVPVHTFVGSHPYVQLINRVTKTEGEGYCKGRGREWESYASNAYSLPVWLWQIVTLFAWLVEPLRRDWPCYIILPLSSSFLPSLIYQSYSPSLPFSFFGLWLKAVRPRPQFLLLLIRRRFFLFSLNVFKLFCNLMFKNFFNILDILDDITGGKKNYPERQILHLKYGENVLSQPSFLCILSQTFL